MVERDTVEAGDGASSDTGDRSSKEIFDPRFQAAGIEGVKVRIQRSVALCVDERTDQLLLGTRPAYQDSHYAA